MNIKDLEKEFLKKNPSLQVLVNKNKKDNSIVDSDGLFVIWGMAIMPTIIEILKDANQNKIVLENIFEFFEEMAVSENEEIQELLMYTILENLGDEKEIINKAIPFMGKKTRKLSQEVEDFLGR